MYRLVNESTDLNFNVATYKQSGLTVSLDLNEFI